MANDTGLPFLHETPATRALPLGGEPVGLDGLVAVAVVREGAQAFEDGYSAVQTMTR